MPRISKGPRLYKRKTKRKNGRIIASAVWTIRDGEREVATGIFAGKTERKPSKAAENALASYIVSKNLHVGPATLKISISRTCLQSTTPIARVFISSAKPSKPTSQNLQIALAA